MKKIILAAFIVIFAILAFLLFTGFFAWLFESAVTIRATPTPAPTFTPLPNPTIIVIATATPLPSPTPVPSATPSPTLEPVVIIITATPPPQPLPSATPISPQVVAATTVNVRAGPGTNYPVVGQLPPNIPLTVIGKNTESTWWQVQAPDGATGWVADSVVSATNTGGVAIAQAPPPPTVPPTPVPPPTPAETPRPQYQYEPTGWYGDTNYGLTRFLGNITDANGNAVNGVSVEANCGDFTVISNPSGPVGWPPFYLSSGDPPGFYDITINNKPVPCSWILTVVETPDGKSVTARLSEGVKVETTVEQSIIVANWRKNW